MDSRPEGECDEAEREKWVYSEGWLSSCVQATGLIEEDNVRSMAIAAGADVVRSISERPGCYRWVSGEEDAWETKM